MTDIQTLKYEATAKYEIHGKWHIIFTNYISDCFQQYDELVTLGYKRAPDSYLIAENMNLSVNQVIRMEKPAELQAQELKAILDKIDKGNAQ